MIITKSPVRISYCGGGSDFPEFFNFQKQLGCVVSSTIAKYVYVFTNPQSVDAIDKFKFTYRITESVTDYKKIKHPVVNRVLSNMDWDYPLNLATIADVPGQSGLGSSSAFTAALIQNLHLRRNIALDKSKLAKEAIRVERKQLNEAGGWQDQFATVYGDFRSYKFSKNGVKISRPLIDQTTKMFLQARQILVSSQVLKTNLSASTSLKNKLEQKSLEDMCTNAQVAANLTEKLKDSYGQPEKCYSHLLEAVNSNWSIKQKLIMNSDFKVKLNKLTKKLSEYNIDAIKLLGSGDGGYLLIMASPSTIRKMTLDDNIFTLKFEFDHKGTRAISF